MCELFAMSSKLPATVNFSLDEFSAHGGAKAPNEDGWGIAFFQDKDIQLIRETEPAAGSECVRFIREHSLMSGTVISHIRRATQGARCLRNTQPFTRELGGRMHVFAHNGNLRGLAEQHDLQLRTFRPVGETDSELAFCILMDKMRGLWLRGTRIPPLSQRLMIFISFIERVRTLGPANIIYGDGDALFVHAHVRRDPGTGLLGPPGLHILARSCATSSDYLEAAGLSISARKGDQDVILIASTPLTAENWVPLRSREIVVLSEGRLLARAIPNIFSRERPGLTSASHPFVSEFASSLLAGRLHQ
jgi:predicted glutamine amidotransferase